MTPENVGQFIGAGHIGVTRDLEPLTVMFPNERQQISADDMLAKVGRDIADLQAAIGRPVVEVRLNGFCQGLGVASVPAAVFFVERPDIAAGAEKLRVEQVAVQLGTVRRQFHRAAAGGDRFLQFPLVLEGSAQVAVRLGIVGLEFQCPAATGDRFVQVSLPLEGNAQVVVRLGIVGLQFQRAAVAGDRFVEFPLLLQGQAQVVVGLGEVRLEFQCAATAGDSVVKLPAVFQGQAQVAVRLGIVGLEFQRAAVAGDRFVRLSHLLQGNAQVILRVGMVRLDREDPPINLLGRLKPAGAVVLHRDHECLGNVCHDTIIALPDNDGKAGGVRSTRAALSAARPRRNKTVTLPPLQPKAAPGPGWLWASA